MQRTFPMLLALLCATGFHVIARADELHNRLHQLANQYCRLRSVEMRATCATVSNESLISSSAPSHLEYDTLFKYAASGDHYNIVTDSDPSMVEGFRFRIAYDGNTFQFMNLSDHHMSVQKQEMDFIPLFFPNPFYAPIAFLSKVSDAQMFCPVKLREASNTESVERLFENAMQVEGTDQLIAQLPLGILSHRAYFGRIYFAKEGYMPVRLERNFSNGDKIDDAIFEEYKQVSLDGHPFFYPTKIHRFQYSTKENQLYSDTHEVITDCAINVPVNASQFTINFDLTEQVLDRDSGELIKEPERAVREFALAHEAPGIAGSSKRAQGTRTSETSLPIAQVSARNSFYRWLGTSLILLMLSVLAALGIWKKKASR